MRARFINEKFNADSDPVHDMGIGIEEFRKQVTKLEITRVLDALDYQTVKILTDFFNLPIEKIYYLGDIYKRVPDNIDDINKAIDEGTEIFNKSIKTSGHRNEYSIIKGYKTKAGKLITMHYTYEGEVPEDNDDVMQYIGDIYAVIEFDSKQQLLPIIMKFH